MHCIQNLHKIYTIYCFNVMDRGGVPWKKLLACFREMAKNETWGAHRIKTWFYLEGKSMTSHQVIFLFHSILGLTCLDLGPLKGLLGWYAALQGPSNLSCMLLPEIQIHEDTVRCAALDAKVSGHVRNK